MAAQQADEAIKQSGKGMKRRGLLAGAGALVAAVLAAQATHDIEAAPITGGTDGAALIIGGGGGGCSCSPNTTVWGTSLISTNGTFPAFVGSNTGGGAGATGLLGSSGSGIGVQGQSTNLHGVVGLSGTGAGASGVVAVGTAPGTVGFQGVAQGGATYAGYFFGAVSIQGSLGVSGSKFAVVKGTDGKHRGMYAMESPECWFEDVGKGKLVGGKAEIKLEPLFAQHIHTDDYHIFLTPYSGVGALRVATQGADGFAVEEIGGASSGAFSWRVMGKRNDIKGERMPLWDTVQGAVGVVTVPDAPPQGSGATTATATPPPRL